MVVNMHSPRLRPIDNYCLLTNVKNGVELVVRGGEVSGLVKAVRGVLESGLRDTHCDYWPLLYDLSHPATRAALARVPDNSTRGEVWIYWAVVEGSLGWYMGSLVGDTKTLRARYTKEALLRDPALCPALLAALDSLSGGLGLQLNPESRDGDSTPSTLASPSDSGVALLDSDDATIISATDNQSYEKRMEECVVDRLEDSELKKERLTGEGVVRRRHGRKPSDENKRVSFHEDVTDTSPKRIHPCVRERSALFTAGGSGCAEAGKEASNLLLARFLRSIPGGAGGRKRSRMRTWRCPVALPPLGTVAPPHLTAETLTELRLAKKPPPQPSSLTEGLYAVLCSHRIYTVVKVTDVEGDALLGVLTESKLFLMNALGSGRCSIRRCIDYKEMSAVIVGVCGELVVVVLEDGRRLEVVVWGGAGELCTSLAHLAPRRLAFLELTAADLPQLQATVAAATSNKGEVVCVRTARLEERWSDVVLMREVMVLRETTPPRWEPQEVVLRRGGCVGLVCGPSLDLVISVAPTPLRPHALLVSGPPGQQLVFAAPNHTDMMDWINAILYTKAWSEGRKRGGGEIVQVVLTQEHLLVTNLSSQLISTLCISDLSQILVSDSYACLLEVECQEVGERTDCSDWVLRFTSDNALHSFLSPLYSVAPSLRQVTGVWLDGGSDQLTSAFDQLVASYCAAAP